MLYNYFNDQGLFPGPAESEENFTKRARYCLNLDKNLETAVGAILPFKVKDRATKEILKEAEQITDPLYGIKPEWTPIFFSNYQLSPWHGGCAWIFQLNEETPTAAFLQLRARFRVQTKYLGIYRREELIAHELSHVGRMMYNEPKFEELLAFRSSKCKWRQFFGPIFQSSRETLFFILLLGLVIFTQLALITVSPQWSLALFWVPLLFIVFGIGRLIWKHWKFSLCLKNLNGLIEKPEHLAYRLLDDEIILFGKKQSSILNYIDEQEKVSFRWKFLKSIYFN